jgi:outer membrane protein TolC
VRLFENHPDLKMLNSALSAAMEVPARAGSLKDPMVSLGVMNLPYGSYSFEDEGMTQKQLALSQSFPAPGKRRLRREIAEYDVEIKSAAVPEKRLDLLENVWILFLRLDYLEKAGASVFSNRAVLAGFVKVALAKYSVGSGLLQDVLRAQTEVSKMEAFLIDIEEEIGIVEAKLALLAYLPVGTDFSSMNPPRLHPPDGRLDRFEKEAVKNRPRFIAMRAAIAKAGKSVELSRKDNIPDYSVKLSYSQRDATPTGTQRDDLVSASVAITIPAWKNSRQDRKIAEDIQLHEAAKQRYESELQGLRIKLASLLETEEKKAKSLAIYNEALLVQAAQTVDATFSAYQVNKVDFLSLVTSQIELFNYEVRRDMVDYKLQASRVTLLRTIGEGLMEVLDVGQ